MTGADPAAAHRKWRPAAAQEQDSEEKQRGPQPEARPPLRGQQLRRRVRAILDEDESEKIPHSLRLAAPSLEARSVVRRFPTALQ